MSASNRHTLSYATVRQRSYTRQTSVARPNGPSALQVSGSTALAPLPAPGPVVRAKPTPPSATTPSPVISFKGRRRPQPKGLQMLILAQRGSFLCASAVTAIALTLYGWTVYAQQRWSTEYDRFWQLQHHEQQLETMTGAMQAQTLQQPTLPSSSEATLMQPIRPEDVVELVPAPLRPVIPESAPTPPAPAWTVTQPIGY